MAFPRRPFREDNRGTGVQEEVWILQDLKANLDQLNEQLRLAKSAGDPWKEGIALNNLGSYYKENKDTDKAIEYFQKALEYFSVLQDVEKKAAVLNNMG